MLHLEAALCQPLTLLLICVVGLDIVLGLRVAHVAVDHGAGVEDHGVVREARVYVEERMRLHIQRALREHPLLELHAVGGHSASEVDTSAAGVLGQLVEAVQEPIAPEANPLITCVRTIVPDREDSVEQRALRRRGSERSDAAGGILREHVQHATGIA